MLITFKSKAAPKVTMLQEHAKYVLDLLNKDVERGVVRAEESAAVIARLEAEMAESRVHSLSEDVQRDVEAHHGEFGDDNEHEPASPVSFSSRYYPLLEMLRAAQKSGHDVLWGV